MLISGQGALAPYQPGLRPGTYTPINGPWPVASGTANPGINTICLSPIWNERGFSITDLAARICTTNAGNMQLGVYAGNESLGRPVGLPVARGGNLSCAAAAMVGGAVVGALATIPVGLIFAAVIYDNAGAGIQVPGTNLNMSNWLIGTTVLANVSTGASIASFNLTTPNSGAFGTWPDLTTGFVFTEVSTIVGAVVYGKLPT